MEIFQYVSDKQVFVDDKFSMLIRASRAALGLTQTEYADMLGVHRTTVVQLEKNSQKIVRQATIDLIYKRLDEQGIILIVADKYMRMEMFPR